MTATYKRALIDVNRGPMSTTHLAVRPWEIPILKEVHGDSAVQIVRGEEQVEHARVLGITTPETIDLSDGAIAAEYDRLCTFYGMHKEVRVTNCERVYGLLEDGKFARAMRAACVRSPDEMADVAADRVLDAVPSQRVVKTLDELRDEADRLGIEWTPETSARVLSAMIQDEIAGATDAVVS